MANRSENFTLFFYAPAQGAAVETAAAAMRAGAAGIVNAEFERDFQIVLSCLDKMEAARTGACGVYGLKLGLYHADSVCDLDFSAWPGLSWLIFDADRLPGEKVLAALKKKAGARVLVECVSGDIPSCTDRKTIDGVILKGNESGGFVGEEASFILLQKWIGKTDLPLYVRGGMTPHVAASCRAAGVAGGVLDSQLLLLEDGALSRAPFGKAVAALSGSETVAAGDNEEGSYFRVLSHPRLKAAKGFIALGEGLSRAALETLVRDSVIDWENPENGILPVGHDVYFAESWRRQYATVANVVKAFEEAIENHPALAAENLPLREDAPLGRALGIRYPIIQGPMTRVSDVPAFAAAVADAGALPMLALALLKGSQVAALLEKSGKALEGRKWGIGLLGFVPPELLEEQIAAALPYKPDYAIIAGGRPDQVVALEARGIVSFLHVPSANLLEGFLKNGARRFIFEGRECGGHIGPLSSFTLWSSVIDRILKILDETDIAADEMQCLFAGGIHDEFSAAFLQVMTAPVAARGVKIGIIMGSAYLFTKEIVESGAILDQFQKVCVDCEKTVVLETGPGHSSRCAMTPFAQTFFNARKTFKADSAMEPGAIREKLDDMILGTLRVASKGVKRAGDALVDVKPKEQKETGMYMLGQVVTLRDKVIGVADLHRQVTDGARALLEKQAQAAARPAAENDRKCADIAIIGMSCALPGAKDIETYWDNILDKVNAVTEVPRERWDARLYFDEDRHAPDKIYSKWGGFLDDMPFDPKKYGITPKSITSVDPMQLMALEVADAALKDTGRAYGAKERARTAVIVGASGGTGDVGLQYGLRSELPRFNGSLPDEVADRLPEWSEDTFAGILINVVAGRIANRLDLGGTNFTTDAACASSMAAIYQACLDLNAGNSDMAIAGGVDTVQGPFGYLCFSKTQALSPRGVCNTFDQEGDGIVISEGIVMLVLKRLADAERDGDRIYSVIKGVGVGSDGKAKGLSAPLPEGQLRAMRRAYEQAGFTPDTIRLFEAHGTGTVAGDTSELESTGMLLKEYDALPRQAVVGSVKTMIGHTKASAGTAGLVKAALALHQKILPPHRGVKTPNKLLADEKAPLYIIDEAQPWLADHRFPRRAAVSAFGFGGTNFHLVLEEYSGEFRPWRKAAPRKRWGAELFVWRGENAQDIAAQLAKAQNFIAHKSDIALRDLAFTLAKKAKAMPYAVAIVAEDFTELSERIESLLKKLAGERTDLPSGVYCSGDYPEGKTAILFPGQGSQYAGMMRDAAVQFPQVAQAIAGADRCLFPAFEKRFGKGKTLGGFIFPRGAYTAQEKEAAENALRGTDVAQPALGAVEAGLWAFLQDLGVRADMMAGHSYGEFAALYAAGRIGFEDLMAVSEARGRLIVDEAAKAGSALGTMAAVKADRAIVEEALTGRKGIVIANHNAPDQTVVSGTQEAIDDALEAFAAAGVRAVKIPVAAAFHSPLVEPARAELAKVIESLGWRQGGAAPVYSNNTARPHGENAAALKKAMTAHLVAPVAFVAQIEAMYEDGARVFIEAGPKNVLSGLVRKILGSRPHVAVSLDDQDGSAAGVLRAAGQILCAGHDLDIMKLFEGRGCLEAVLEEPAKIRRVPEIQKHFWLINGAGARKAGEPPRQIGVTLEQAQAMKEQAWETSRAAIAASPLPALQDRQNRTGFNASQRRIRQTMTNPYQNSVAQAYFELLARQLDNARDVALAELGALPEAMQRQAAAIGSGSSMPLPVAPRAVPASSVTPMPRRVAAEAPRVAVSAPQAAPASVPVSVPANVNGANGAMNGKSATAVSSAAPAVNGKAENEKGGKLDDGKLKEIILAVVTEKTGYEADMIEFDQNMEADLGIDSIKRVEIVGDVLDKLPGGYAQALGNGGRSKLSTAGTLGKMLSYIREAGDSAVNFNQAGTGAFVAEEVSLHPFRQSEDRFKIVTEREDIPEGAAADIPSGAVFILPDQAGVSEEIAARLQEKGCAVYAVPKEALRGEEDCIAWCEGMAQKAEAVCGIVHLAALDDAGVPVDAEKQDFRDSLFRNEKTLYLMLRHFAAKIVPQARVLAASALGGCFARDGKTGETLLLQGGAPGILKSFRKEREDVFCKAVDLDRGQEADAVAAQLLAEFCLEGGRIEVGYPQGRRVVFRTVPEKLPQALPVLAEKKRVVLATGGARGITAEVLRSFAKPGHTLILTGRSALPGKDAALRDDPQTASLSDEKDIARFFVKERGMAIGEARRKAAAVLAAREQIDNIEDFEKAGAKVEYRAVDVADEESMAALMQDIYARHGNIDGIVHGAGIIEDKYLADITPESWSRVVETKVMGLLLLQKFAKPETLEFFTVFSSVAGRYGNSGQSNYAQANEIMNRLCCQIQQHWKNVRVSALCWGPWGKTKCGAGMVTPETQAKFERVGVYLVQAKEGRDLFFYQAVAGGDGVEIICGEGPWEKDESIRGAVRHGMNDQLLGAASCEKAADGKSAFVSILIDRRHAYLQDHIIDGNPVLPMAVALEMMAQAAAKAFPDAGFIAEINNGQLFKGVIVDRDEYPLQIALEAQDPEVGGTIKIKAKIVAPGSKPRMHYGVVIVLKQSLAEAEERLPVIGGVSDHPVTSDEAYGRWLFHGPRFQVIEAIDTFAERGASCAVRSTDAAAMMETDSKDQWFFDPGLVDAAAHMSVLWMSLLRDSFALPVKFGRIVRYGVSMPPRVRMDYIVREEKGDSLIVDTRFIDENGKTVLLIEGMQHIASKTHATGVASAEEKKAAGH